MQFHFDSPWVGKLSRCFAYILCSRVLNIDKWHQSTRFFVCLNTYNNSFSQFPPKTIELVSHLFEFQIDICFLSKRRPHYFYILLVIFVTWRFIISRKEIHKWLYRGLICIFDAKIDASSKNLFFFIFFAFFESLLSQKGKGTDDLNKWVCVRLLQKKTHTQNWVSFNYPLRTIKCVSSSLIVIYTSHALVRSGNENKR